MAEQIYYHVVAAEWTDGENLYCLDELIAQGIREQGNWEDETVDSDIVSLHETIEAARQYRDEWAPGARIVAVDGEGLRIRRNREGYACVVGYISAERISVAE